MSALETLADATGSSRGQLVGVGPGMTEGFNWITHASDAMVEAFLATGGMRPETNFRVAAAQGRGVLDIIHEADYAPYLRQSSRRDLLDFCEQYEILNGCQTILHEESGFIGLAVLRSDRDGATTERQREAFATAAGAAREAVLLQRAIEQDGAALVAGAMNAISISCFVIDEHGRVRGMSRGGEALLGCGRLRLVEERLRPPIPWQAAEVDRALKQHLATGCMTRVCLDDGAGEASLIVEFQGLPQREWTLGYAPRSLVVVRGDQRAPEAAEILVADRFGLTSAEAAIALGIYGGAPRAQIAAERGVSIQTIRAQVRSIFQKTGCHREAALVARLASLLH